MVAVVVVQRQTVEWSQLSDGQFRDQSVQFCRLWGKPDEYIWHLFQLWNATFCMDYREVRQALKELSLENIHSASDITFVPYVAGRDIPELPGYYLFLDDDDWLDPKVTLHLQQQVRQFTALPPLLLWRSANIGSPNQEYVVFVWGMNGRCMTNNYAVHGSWLKPFSKINDVFQHKDATGVFERPGTVPHLDCALTVSNKSPISSVSLDRGLDGDLCPERLLALVENYVDRMSRVQDAELVYMPWSRPWIDRTVELFRQVLASRR